MFCVGERDDAEPGGVEERHDRLDRLALGDAEHQGTGVGHAEGIALGGDDLHRDAGALALVDGQVDALVAVIAALEPEIEGRVQSAEDPVETQGDRVGGLAAVTDNADGGGAPMTGGKCEQVSSLIFLLFRVFV